MGAAVPKGKQASSFDVRYIELTSGDVINAARGEFFYKTGRQSTTEPLRLDPWFKKFQQTDDRLKGEGSK
jgi:hypothetical protein